jgi:hypothetical protein
VSRNVKLDAVIRVHGEDDAFSLTLNGILLDSYFAQLSNWSVSPGSSFQEQTNHVPLTTVIPQKFLSRLVSQAINGRDCCASGKVSATARAVSCTAYAVKELTTLYSNCLVLDGNEPRPTPSLGIP